MIRRLVSALIVIASALPCPAVLAQQDDRPPEQAKRKTLQYAEPAKAKAAVGVEVIPRPKEPTVLKEWPLDRPGTTAMGVTVYITKVQLWSDGRMRWNLSFWNRSNENQTIYFDFEEMIVADPQSNPYPQLARNIVSGNRNSIYMRSIPRDQRFNTWVDYKAPESPTTTFKVGVMLEGRYDHRADAFKPFLVTLNEPLFLDNGVFRVEKAVEVPALIPGDDRGQAPGFEIKEGAKPAIAGGFVGPMPTGRTPSTPPRASVGSSPRDIEEREQRFRSLSDDGRWIDGNLFMNEGTLPIRGRIVFKKRDSRAEFVEATILGLGKSSPINFEVHGSFFVDLKSSTGIALKLRGGSKEVYTLYLDGNALSGTDTLGNRYSFNVPEKK